ncbi:MAG: urea ABC transporter permease subunit UrtC, partial [Pseudomonadota bacterium]
EAFPELWLLGFGALFIAVVLVFPSGLAGIYDDWIKAPVLKLLSKKGAGEPDASEGPAPTPASPAPGIAPATPNPAE